MALFRELTASARTKTRTAFAALTALVIGCSTSTEARPQPDIAWVLGTWRIRYVSAVIGTDSPCYIGFKPGCRHDTITVLTAEGTLNISAVYDSGGPSSSNRAFYKWGRATSDVRTLIYNYPPADATCSGKPVPVCWHAWIPGTAALIDAPLLSVDADSLALTFQFANIGSAGRSDNIVFSTSAKPVPVTRWYDSTKFGVIEIRR
jgi:hypothetical protein